MSRATPLPPARRLLILFATAFVAMSAALSLGTAQAGAAKPCWERLIDDWVDNGRFDGTYSAACIEQARNHLPEDIRAYSDIEEKIDGLRLLAARSNTNDGDGNGSLKGPTPSKPSTTPTDDQPTQAEPNPDAGTRNSGPFVEALNPNTNSADSIPLPLILLAGLALLLMAAGATGIAHRKLQARRANVRRPS
jgi:hypothetical protein